MKRLISVLAPSALAVGVLCACGPSKPPAAPSELQDAREAYKRAESGPAAQLDSAQLIEAKAALDQAEEKFKDQPDAPEVKTLGYVAERKAEIADANGRAAAATVQQAGHERAAAGRSERRASLALSRLGLSAKEEPQGTVVTLPGASMFATNKAEILPSAKGRLTEIANAMKQVLAQGAPQDVGRKMILVGYTDDTGTEEHNLDLSKRRADAVRDFFAQHGLDASMMETEGKGEADPIADNKNAKGRAQNRRVEIVITPARGQRMAPSAPQQQQPQGGGGSSE